MRKRPYLFIFILIGVLVLSEGSAYMGIYFLLHDHVKESILQWFTLAYWAETLMVPVVLILLSGAFRKRNAGVKRTYYAFQGVGFLIADVLPKLLFSFFVLMVAIVQGIYVMLNCWFIHRSVQRLNLEDLLIIGAMLSLLLLLAIIRGIIVGRFDFRVVEQNLYFDNLPESFNGLRIVQFSDMHIGSFYNHHAKVKKAIEMINALSPDLILFTGDMVNNVAEETEEWKEILLQLNARIGKYSILGNHDYGDYVHWPSEEAKKQNLQALINFEKSAGLDILLNENRILEKNGEKIAVIGVENWGSPPFAQYGCLSNAVKGTENIPFSILLSHDPSHWGQEVAGKTNIALTLSGHTHGMQFGIKIGKWKWSPVQWRYEHWQGLYKQNKQYLYVNMGLGHIGFPGRVGMLPEITRIELRRSENEQSE